MNIPRPKDEDKYISFIKAILEEATGDDWTEDKVKKSMGL